MPSTTPPASDLCTTSAESTLSTQGKPTCFGGRGQLVLGLDLGAASAPGMP